MSNKIYGIDLGTTNSLIGCDGRLITRLISSKVDFKNRKNVPSYEVGDGIVGSYKVDMGLGKEGEMSIEASSITLQTLVDYVKKETGDTVENVIISVPAYFSSNQRKAIRLAAEKIGLNLVKVINEPTAAAIEVCSGEGNGILQRGVFAVYDLGGGTFDCTIIDSRTGSYHVVGTDGCILGGDNLDRAIAEKVIKECKIPFFKRNDVSYSQLIENCKDWKLRMQECAGNFCDDSYEEVIKLPTAFQEEGKPKYFKLSLGEYRKLVKDTFGKTVSILSNLIDSKVPKGTKVTLVFVGGSTHCPCLCNYVLESTNIKYDDVEFAKNPDYTVAMGVIKYATSIQNGEKDVVFSDVTKQLSIENKEGKAVVIIPANTTIPCEKTKIVTNSNKTDTLRVKLYQGNSAIAANNEYIGYLEYKYDFVKEAGEGDVEVTVKVDSNGIITLEVEDIVSFGEKKSIELRGF